MSVSQSPGEGAGGNQSFLSLPEEERLEIAMRSAPRGAMALAAIAVGIVILVWLAIYVFVFLARGNLG